MKRRFPIPLAMLLAACSSARLPEPAAAPAAPPQAPAAAAPQAAALPPSLVASARVDLSRTEVVPAEIELERGDTVTLQVILRDASGARVSEARWGLRPPPGVGVRRTRGASDTYLVWGQEPAEGAIQALLVLPGEGGLRLERLATVPVEVNEWPAARIEIEPPAYAPYVGSTFALSGRVVTTHETEHATAVITWSSSDPEIVSMTRGGVASFKKPGRAVLGASSEGLTVAYEVEVLPSPVATVELGAVGGEPRTGDVVRLEVTVENRRGGPVRDAHVAYSVSAVEGPEGGAVVYDDGALVAEQPGTYRVIAEAGGRSASAVISAVPRAAEREVKLLGRGPITHVETSDIWVFEGRDGRDYAYTGTHAGGGGERLFVWNVTNPASPVLTDSVVVDARVVNDVKVNEEATVAIITREGASDRRNGIVILDIRDPAHPFIVSELTENLTGGIHNVWFNGGLLYAINDGTMAVHIIDIADPAQPREVGRWEWRPGESNKYLHDVWAKDGLAYVSYWDDGLIILDVGAGIKGGTPREPKFVSQYKYPIGNTHVAFRHGDYVFVGDEFITCPECINGPRGYIHVIDVSDIESPKEVGRFEVPEAGAHNVWVEDDILYVAYYQGGLRIVDVSGELRGDLYAQGRQIAHYHTAGAPGEAFRPNSPMAWGPQPFKGKIFVSDHYSGLWVVQLEPPREPLLP